MISSSFPVLKKTLQEKFYFQNSEQENKILEKMGKNVLELFYLKFRYKNISDSKYQKIQEPNRFAQAIIEKIEISEAMHLKHCLGDIFGSSNYKQLTHIENQIHNMIQRGLGQSYNISQTRDTIYSDQKKQYRNHYSDKITSTINGHKNKKIEEKQQDETIDSLLKQLSISSINSNAFKSDTTFSLSEISVQNGYAPNSQMTNLDVQQYLKNDVRHYTTQLNLLMQKFNKSISEKPGAQKFQDLGIQKIYSNTIIVTDQLAHKSAQVSDKGKGNNKKEARNQFSLHILQKLYHRYPGLCFRMKNK